MHLVSDIEALRNHFNIETWHVFGGSWGSTLSLISRNLAPRTRTFIHPRGIFMCRKSELHWFYQDGASHVFPDAFEPYQQHIPADEQSALIPSLLQPIDKRRCHIRRNAAKEWNDGRWRRADCSQTLNISIKQKIWTSLSHLRIECHYFINGIFVEDSYILNNTESIQHIPTIIVQGRYDMVCPVKSAWELHKQLPNSDLQIIPDAGHSMGEVPIASALIEATDSL